MIILLVLIFLAILFPGALRMMLGVMIVAVLSVAIVTTNEPSAPSTHRVSIARRDSLRPSDTRRSIARHDPIPHTPNVN